MMKSFVSIICMVLATLVATPQKVSKELYDRMKEACEIYRKADTAAERKAALERMNEIDDEMKYNAVIEQTQNLDTLTASAHDFRNLGVLLEASGYGEYSHNYFVDGALRGDAYCLNRVFVNGVREKNDISSIGEILTLQSQSTSVYPPLYYNIALVLSTFLGTGDKELEEIGMVAKPYLEMYNIFMDQTMFSRGPYPLNDYLKVVNVFGKDKWVKPSSHEDVEKQLNAILKLME